MAEAENIIEIISKDQFDEVIKSEKLIIADFWGVHCMPCKVLKPLLHKIASEHTEIELLTIEVQEWNQDLAMEYGVNYLPTVHFFKNGEIVDSFVGVMPENEILEKIEANK